MAHQLCIACKYLGISDICHGRCSYINLFRAEDMNATFGYYGVAPTGQQLVDVNSENNKRIRESTMRFEYHARDKDHIYGITEVILLLSQYLWRNSDYESCIKTGVWYGWNSPTAVLIEPDITAPQVPTDTAAQVQHQPWTAVPTYNAEQVQHQPCTACFFLARSCSSDCEFAPFFSPDSSEDFRYVCRRLFTRRTPVEIPSLRKLSRAEITQIMYITTRFELRIREREYDPIYGASRILLTLVRRLFDVNGRLDSLVRSIAFERHQRRVSMGVQHQTFNDLPFPRKYNYQQIGSPDRERNHDEIHNWSIRLPYQQINQASTGRGIVRYNENIGRDISWQQQQQQEQTHHRQLVRQHGQHPQPPQYSSEIVVQQQQRPAPTAMNWGGLQRQQHQQQHHFHKRALEGCELQRSRQRPRLQLPRQPVPQHPEVRLPRPQHLPQHPEVPLPRPQHPAVPLPRSQHPAVLPSQSQQHRYFGIDGSSSASVVGQSNFNSSSIASQQDLPAALRSLEYYVEDEYFVNQFRQGLVLHQPVALQRALQPVALQPALQPVALQQPHQPAMPSQSREHLYSGIGSSSSATVVGLPSNPNSSSTASHRSVPAPSGLYDSGFLEFPQENQ